MPSNCFNVPLRSLESVPTPLFPSVLFVLLPIFLLFAFSSLCFLVTLRLTSLSLSTSTGSPSRDIKTRKPGGQMLHNDSRPQRSVSQGVWWLYCPLQVSPPPTSGLFLAGVARGGPGLGRHLHVCWGCLRYTWGKKGWWGKKELVSISYLGRNTQPRSY